MDSSNKETALDDPDLVPLRNYIASLD
jgi:hypothetical protein